MLCCQATGSGHRRVRDEQAVPGAVRECRVSRVAHVRSGWTGADVKSGREIENRIPKLRGWRVRGQWRLRPAGRRLWRAAGGLPRYHAVPPGSGGCRARVCLLDHIYSECGTIILVTFVLMSPSAATWHLESLLSGMAQAGEHVAPGYVCMESRADLHTQLALHA